MSSIDATATAAQPPMTTNPATVVEETEEKTSTTTEESAQPTPNEEVTSNNTNKENTNLSTSDLVPVSAATLRTLQQKLQQSFQKLDALLSEGGDTESPEHAEIRATLKQATEALDEANVPKLVANPPLENRRKRRVANQRKAKKTSAKKDSNVGGRDNAGTAATAPTTTGVEKAEGKSVLDLILPDRSANLPVTKDGAIVESRQRAKQPQRTRSPPFPQMRPRSMYYPEIMPPLGPTRGAPPPFYGYQHPPPPPRYPYDFAGMRPLMPPHEEAFLRFGPQAGRRGKERPDLVKQEKDQAEIRNELRKAQTMEQLQHVIEKAKHLSMDYEVTAATKHLNKLKEQA